MCPGRYSPLRAKTIFSIHRRKFYGHSRYTERIKGRVEYHVKKHEHKHFKSLQDPVWPWSTYNYLSNDATAYKMKFHVSGVFIRKIDVFDFRSPLTSVDKLFKKWYWLLGTQFFFLEIPLSFHRENSSVKPYPILANYIRKNLQQQSRVAYTYHF